ncbi:MAG: exo-alpha-sialidase [Clostridiales bacterium]|nr:exo-alpha-sialidase [Clostridiales bacterium]
MTGTPDFALSEKAALGATFRISHDNGVTFGPLHHSPVTSPHGPLELPDGRLYWMGRHFNWHGEVVNDHDFLAGYDLDPETGEMTYAGRIPPLPGNAAHLLPCEPHAILLPSGRMICHIRVQNDKKALKKIFTIYQSESDDLGRTWSVPRQILSDLGGSPAHLIRHSSGVLISVYGYREAPYGVKTMFSKDDGEIWDTDHDLYINGIGSDLGYPASVEHSDGSLLTVFYARPQGKENTVIMQTKWRILE